MKRYERLADEIAALIHKGVMKRGDRLPSTRQASIKNNISPSTVFRAYYLLEARGLIRARERSGYYVTGSLPKDAAELALFRPTTSHSKSVEVSELVFEVLKSIQSRNIVPFGSAFLDPSLLPLNSLSKSLARAIQKLGPWNTVENFVYGNAELRRLIALRYLSDGLQVHPDDILITNGAIEALNLCLATVARPGDSVIIESPTFYGVLQALERRGLNAIEVPTHSREGMDLAALESALERHHPKACWLMTNFQNPLGSLMPEEKKKALVELLGRFEVPLIEDDVYGELYFGNKRPVAAKAFDTKSLVMHCSSFSKCLAPGYRIGWAIAGRFSEEVARCKMATTLATSASVQAGLADYLNRGGYDKHLRQLRRTLAEQQTIFTQAISQYFPSGTYCTKPDGGYFLWVELPIKVDTLELYRQALAMGISIAPGPMFSATRSFRNCFRLNYGHFCGTRTEEALKVLGQSLHAIQKSAIV